MLQTIRDRAQGWVAGVIVALIIIPFALWGINSYIDAVNTVVVAEVEGDDIELDQYRDALQQFRLRLQAAGGEDFRLSDLDPSTLKQEALAALVREKLIDLFGEANGLRISDEQVAAQISTMPEFKQDGTFSRELYETRVRAGGLGPTSFERSLRHDMLREQLRRGLSDSAFATEADYQRYARLFNQTRTLAYAIVPAAPFLEAVAPKPEQVEAYYRDNPELFTSEEAVKVAWVELSLDDLAAQVQFDEAGLEAWYEANKASYTLPEQRRGEYVLVPAPKEASAEEVAAAEAKAQDFLRQLREGKAFTELEGLGSEEEGGPQIEVGESGLVQRGMLPEPLEKVLFSLEPGVLSDVVRSEYGFHVVRVTEIKPGGAPSLAESRQELETAYRRELAEKRYFERAEELQNLAFEHPDSLEPVAQTLGLEIRSSEFFTRRDAQGVLAEGPVLEAAFGPEVVRDGVNSVPVELEGSRVVVMRLLEHRPAALRPLEEVRPEVELTLKQQGARQRAAERGEALIERLVKGEARDALAAAETLEWKQVEKTSRSDTSVPRPVLRTAFRLGRPAEGAPRFGGTPLGNGDYALVTVLDVVDGDPAQVKPEDAETARKGLTALYGGQAWEDFLAEIESEAEVKTYPEQLERL